MKERIKLVRKEAGETQDAFADNLKVSKNYICLIENGKKEPSERLLNSIAEKYRVNETWLLTGEGGIHSPATREQEIAQITAALYEADPDGMPYKFMKALSDLKPETWKDIGEFIKKVAAEEE